MRLLVLSDLHVFSKLKRNADEPSYYKVDGKASPLSSLKIEDEFIAYVKRLAMPVDYVVCCGDLAHQADERGMLEAWRFLSDVKVAAGAAELLVTAGNHDVDSRFKTSKGSPTEFLRTLSPRFPTSEMLAFNQYWANEFYIRDDTKCRFLIINSSAAHGYRKEYEHGRVSDEALGLIEKALTESGHKSVNICVCHHHPHRHSEKNLGDVDDIKNGQYLIDLLSSPGMGQWVIIHGHKHHPKISYAQGNSFSPAVFSAGSLSARLFPELQKSARNQFYILESATIDVPGAVPITVWKFRAWSWFAAEGWREAGPSDGLPHEGGFGYRDVLSLSAKLVAILPVGATPWADVVAMVPEIDYVMPADLSHLLEILSTKGIRASHDGKKIDRFIRE